MLLQTPHAIYKLCHLLSEIIALVSALSIDYGKNHVAG
jgi:hypothetical protein